MNFIYNFNLDEPLLGSLRAFVSSYSRAWNPYFFNSILGSRIRFTVLNPLSVYTQLKRSFLFIQHLMSKGGKLLIVNEHLTSHSHQTPYYSVLKEWTPGVLTNKIIIKNILSRYSLRFLIPSATLLIGTNLRNVSFLKESSNVHVPSVAFLDTHFSHNLAQYTILSSVNLDLSNYYMSLLSQLILNTSNLLKLNYVTSRFDRAQIKSNLARRPGIFELAKSLVRRVTTTYNNSSTIIKKKKGINLFGLSSLPFRLFNVSSTTRSGNFFVRRRLVNFDSYGNRSLMALKRRYARKIRFKLFKRLKFRKLLINSKPYTVFRKAIFMASISNSSARSTKKGFAVSYTSRVKHKLFISTIKKSTALLNMRRRNSRKKRFNDFYKNKKKKRYYGRRKFKKRTNRLRAKLVTNSSTRFNRSRNVLRPLSAIA